jgi:hypothetical protein
MSESRSGEHQELREQFRIAAPGVPAAEATFSNVGAAEQSPYQVTLSNQTDFTYNVAIAYQMKIGEVVSPVLRTDLKLFSPAGSVVFELTPPGQCANLLAYVIGLYPQGAPVVLLPEEGVFTPETFEDPDRCGDKIAIRPA